MSQEQRPDHSFSGPIKYTLVIVAISLIVNFSIRADIRIFNQILELSFTEVLQNVCILFSAFLFYQISKQQNYHFAGVLITAFFLVLLVRESDFYLDFISHGFWAVPASIITVLSLGYFFRNGKVARAQLAALLNEAHMTKVIAGVVLLIVFSRNYGTGSFWQEVMGEHYIRNVKNIAQEGIELLCYFLISVGAFDTKKAVTD